jgi:hypothetical protein
VLYDQPTLSGEADLDPLGDLYWLGANFDAQGQIAGRDELLTTDRIAYGLVKSIFESLLNPGTVTYHTTAAFHFTFVGHRLAQVHVAYRKDVSASELGTVAIAWSDRVTKLDMVNGVPSIIRDNGVIVVPEHVDTTVAYVNSGLPADRAVLNVTNGVISIGMSQDLYNNYQQQCLMATFTTFRQMVWASHRLLA